MLSHVGVAVRRALLLLPFAGAIASAQTLGGLALQGTGAGFNIIGECQDSCRMSCY
jgi:hypothetical protein